MFRYRLRVKGGGYYVRMSFPYAYLTDNVLYATRYTSRRRTKHDIELLGAIGIEVEVEPIASESPYSQLPLKGL